MVTQIYTANQSTEGTTLVRKSKPKTTDIAKTSNTSAISNTSNVSNSNFQKILDKETSSSGNVDLDSIFEKASKTYNVPVELLKAVAKAESDFQPNEVSSSGAVGIMQLMPATAKELGVSNSYDPEQNIMGGAKYLSQKLKEYDGDVSLTLAAYNAGSGNVKKYGGIPPFKETQNYVKKVLSYMNDSIDAPQVTAKSQNEENAASVNSAINTVNQENNTSAITLAQTTNQNSAFEPEDAYQQMKMSESYWRIMDQLFSSEEDEESFA